MQRYFLGLMVVGLAIMASPLWASRDTSGIRLSAYGGVQRLTVDPSSFTLAGGQIERLAPYHKMENDFTGGVGAAYRFIPAQTSRIARFANDISIGLDVFYFEAVQSGDTFDYRIFNNFNYRLNVQSVRFMANGEWTFPAILSWIYPFLEGGIGIASNTASYFDTPNANAPSGINLSLGTSTGVNIAKGTTTQFAYDVGAGVKVPLYQHLELSFRYLYANVGAANTSKNANLPVTSAVHVSLAPQTWLLGLSYLV